MKKKAAKPSKKKSSARKPRKPGLPVAPPLPDMEGANDPTSALTYREELFVENLFLTGFKPMEAFARAGYAPKTADPNAYIVMERPRVAAAIEHRRNELRRRSMITREEWLHGLANDTQNMQLAPVDRHRAGALMARALGWDRPGIAEGDTSGQPREITPEALRALPFDEAVQAFNSGMGSRAKSRVIDVAPDQRAKKPAERTA